VRLTGLFQQDDYLLSISDRGVGLPDDLIDELNRTLEDPAAVSGPEPKMGIALVARLARRHEIRVQLVPGVPGTTARVVLPGNLVTKLAETPGQPPVDHRLPARLPDGAATIEPPLDAPVMTDDRPDTVDLTRLERRPAPGSGVVAMSESARREAELFLEKVFAPLVNRPGMTERPTPRAPLNGNGAIRRPEARPDSPAPERPVGTVTALRVRVPGELLPRRGRSLHSRRGKGHRHSIGALQIRAGKTQSPRGRDPSRHLGDGSIGHGSSTFSDRDTGR
jgi:hypothetical protein